MGFMDNLKDVAKKGIDEAKKAQDHHQEKETQKSEDMKAHGIALQLKSVDGMVTLFDTHIEIKSLLGSKSRNIPYTAIETVYLDKSGMLAKGTAAFATLGASLAVTKKTIVISTGENKFKLDFRIESQSKIKQALDIINGKIASKYSPTVTVTIPTNDNNSSTSAADELAKFAELRKQEVISEEEFQAKKRDLLGL